MNQFLRLLFLTLVFAADSEAQPYYFRHYQVEKGLSNNTVFCSIQDKTGFMWFGTKDGLNRFDGYRFKLFNIPNKDKSSITRDQISSLAIDQKGVLWVGSQKGLFRFDEEKEKLVPFIDSLPDIDDLFVDKAGQLWFRSASTLGRYNFRKKELTLFPTAEYFVASGICQADDGGMWFATTTGQLHQFNESTKSFKAYDLFTHSPTPASRWLTNITPGEKGELYIGTSSQGIKRFNTTTGKYVDELMHNPDQTNIFVRDIIRASQHEFWFATESGLFIKDTRTGKFTNIKKKYLDPYSLSDNAVYSLHKDKEGGIWVGTYFGGVNYFAKQYSSFQKYFPDYTKNSISGNAVREICEDRYGNVWIGTEDAGLNKLNTKTGELTQFRPNGASTSIAYSNIHGLLVVKDHLWIGTFEHGLDIMDVRTGRVVKHYGAGTTSKGLQSNFMVSFLQTRSGDIYVGSSTSLLKYLPQSDRFIQTVEQGKQTFVSCLMEDKSGTIWAGTHGKGIFYFNPYTKEEGVFINDATNKNSLTTNSINALYEDSFNNIWVATEGGGLCRLSKDKKNFTRYNSRTGLPSNFIFKVLEDNKQNLWITTSKGLVKMDIRTAKTTVYTTANGLLNDQFNYNSGFKDARGKIYFGSVRGMITFKPDEFYENQFIAPVRFTGFQVHNEEVSIDADTSVLKKSIVHASEINLPYNQSSFSIDFASLSYTSPEATEYSYRMEGVDPHWTNIKSNRKVYFTNLAPGTYTFRVKAGYHGSWNHTEKQLTIRILPPFWATNWAYLFYLICSALIVYYLFKAYHHMHMNKKEKDIYEAKIEFFTNIAHEIRTPLTLIKGPVENLSEMVDEVPAIKEDVTTMERNTNRLINLINQILDFRQTETKGFSLDFTNVNITDVLKEAYITFEPVAKKKNLEYIIDMPSRDVYTMADTEALNKIFSNLFSNAVKYAHKDVYIKLWQPAKGDDFLIIEIKNDGFIIPAEMRFKIFEPFYRLKETMKQKGTGIGLALARSLVELHKGHLFMKDAEAHLNVFVVRIPYYYPFPNKRKKEPETNTQLAQTN